MEQAMISGVSVTPQKRIENPKGDIYHAMKKSQPGFCGFGEAYFSTIHNGDVKGWKRHNRMTLNLVVPTGAIKFVVHDDREDSVTRGDFFETILSSDNYARLTVEPGLWMAFEGVGPAINMLLNILDEEHDPNEADDVALDTFTYFGQGSAP
jgi:dTDP-4-dehydrorhamnose 3,5-epimerase